MSQKVLRTDFLDSKWDLFNLITGFTFLIHIAGFHLVLC